MSGTLYIVATPIGNLSDMSERAIETLKNVDLIAAEDTRNTSILLKRFDIRTPMSANHKFNERETLSRFTGELLAGKSIAVVSDAGTPCINDPGYVLTRECAELGINVVGIPGPCAAATVVSVSGLPSDSFCFMGFFPRGKKEREDVISYIRGNRSELYVFYESPNRIEDALSFIEKGLPEAKITLCNDLTKLHERIYRGSVGEVLSELSANPNAGKGEYAFALYYERAEVKEEKTETLSLEAMLADLIVKRGCTLKEAVSILASEPIAEFGGKVPAAKKEIYQASLRLKDMFS